MPTEAPVFERLFSPCELGSLRLKNRIALLPQGTGLVRDGAVTDADIAYYEARAAGGVGLIVTGGTGAHPATQLGTRNVIEAYNEAALPSLSRRVAAVHRHDCRLIGQLFVLGREMPAEAMVTAPVAPSALRARGAGFPPHELRPDEIRELVHAFATSAANLREAGCDGVEIHAAHGYLVAQFLSPATNRRQDVYGGSPDARLRFLIEIIEAVRTLGGNDWPLGIRLSVDEEIPGGLSVADTSEIVNRLESSGLIDYLSLTVGVKGRYVKDMSAPPGVALTRIAEVRRGTDLPVLAAGRILTPEQAERALSDEQCDVIGLSRALIADPDWAQKARRGESARIRPCVGANQECRTQALGGLRCTLNAGAGRGSREREAIPAAASAKRVVVVGGGPGGLEAARLSALAGHEVTLFERSEQLGGQLRIAAAAPYRRDFLRFIDYLKAETQRLGVEVVCGCEATAPVLTQRGAELVIVATGAQAIPPDPELRHAGARVLSAWELLAAPSEAEFGERALVVDDGTGFWHACSAVESLCERGLRVVLATPANGIGLRIPPESLAPLYERLAGHAVRFEPFTQLEAVDAAGATLIHTLSGKRTHEPADTVVVHAGQQAEDALVRELVAAEFPVRAIGDCVAPRLLTQAIYEAGQAARSLSRQEAAHE